MNNVSLVSELPTHKMPPCGILANRKGACLVLSLRQMGDAVIGSGVINALQGNNPELAIDVLAPPNLNEVITSFSSIREVIGVNFPVFGHHRRDLISTRETFRHMRMVRERRYDYCINLIGDIRENFIGMLTGAKWNIAPIWEQGHLFKHKMTDTGASWWTNCGVKIPAKYSSFYESMDHFAKQLGLSGLEWPGRSDRKKKTDGRITVAIHPGASHASRQWPEEEWRTLIGGLYAQGHEVKVLGAGFERGALLGAFSREVANREIEIVTGDIACFVSSLSAADVLVGMDSFSVHAAYALGVPAVVLNGSADPLILTPPGGIVASAGHLCKQYPCYYRYPCRGTGSEYICVRGIQTAMVMAAVEKALGRDHHRATDTSQMKVMGIRSG